MPENKVFYAALAVLGVTAFLWVMDMITDLLQPAFIWMLMAGAVILVAGMTYEIYLNRRKPDSMEDEDDTAMMDDETPEHRQAA